MIRLAAPGLALGLLALWSCAQRPAPPPPVAAAPETVPMPPPLSAAIVAAGAGNAPVPDAATALAAGVEVVGAGPVPLDARAALAAFVTSCPALLARADGSGLTRGGDWAGPCAEAARVQPGGETGFFNTRLTAVRVGGGDAFVTGYFEPEIAGARAPSRGFGVPVYRRPADLVETRATGRRASGRMEGGRIVPHHDRAAIEDGALRGQGLELAWAADPIDLFFLEIQGSGRLIAPDGQVIRIGYDGQNGHPYTAIGALLRQRGELERGRAGLEEIKAWLRADPDRGRALMRENRSFVFFRELTGPGPIGAMGAPVTPRHTVAVDPAFVPLGAPVLIDTGGGAGSGLWIAQDTGGAIRGANRFDTFWGAGAPARRVAGPLSSPARALILIPNEAAARLSARRASSQR